MKFFKKRKKIVIGITSIFLVAIMGVSGYFITSKLLKKKKTNGPTNSTTTSQSNNEFGTGRLDSLGEELPKDNKNTEYTKVSGDINLEDIVRGADGILYDSQASADKAGKVGTTKIDTKNDTLVVGDNGKVYTKEQGYEIVDSEGNVVESGTGTPKESEQEIEYVECSCNYYDDFGNLVYEVGELITPQELENCKKNLHTEKPVGDEYAIIEEEIIYDDAYTTPTGSDYEVEISDVESEEESTEYTETDNSNVGIFNEDGTYTLYGITYASYADYQQYIISGGEGYGYIDGIIQPIGDYEIEYQYTR